MDCYYLGLFYWCLCTQLAVCLLALLASQFSFILPLIFYSKYIDAATWGYRFRLMTLLIMSAPLQLAVIAALHRWPGGRVDSHPDPNPNPNRGPNPTPKPKPSPNPDQVADLEDVYEVLDSLHFSEQEIWGGVGEM